MLALTILVPRSNKIRGGNIYNIGGTYSVANIVMPEFCPTPSRRRLNDLLVPSRHPDDIPTLSPDGCKLLVSPQLPGVVVALGDLPGDAAAWGQHPDIAAVSIKGGLPGIETV